jgi:ribosomal protein S18 acetylase RimI-like enzyme
LGQILLKAYFTGGSYKIMAVSQVLVRPLQEDDLGALFNIFGEILLPGDVFPYPDDTTFEQFEQIWMPVASFSYVAVCEGQVRGGYFVKPQWPGRGSHVATATYMVAKAARGQGLGLTLGQHSLAAARERGHTAMQFNQVLSTNLAAVALWQKLGFNIIGTVPGGFNHAVLGPVDTYLMHRFL